MSAEKKLNEPNPGFPVAGIMPKAEIQASQFIERHPEYDGRGVVVSIFDTGVDPGAPGLQVTTDGRRKMIDFVDTTGSGDVDTSTVVTATSPNGNVIELKGLSGRTLKLKAEWTNPSGKYHIGLKRAYELFPNELSRRIKTIRKEGWSSQSRELEATLRSQLSSNSLSKKARQDLEAQLSELASMDKNMNDAGPMFDCVVWHDGSRYRAIMDTTESGDLTGLTPMTDYRHEHQFGTISGDDLMNYSFNIYEDGRVLSVVVTAGSHGTHVAGICGGYFPEQPELNGVAPGCQMISIKIGDSRLGSMETGAGLERALLHARFHKVDLINMSYGEATSLANVGRFSQLANELVNKHGVIFVSSAGNAGPALSTVGAPGGTTEAIIGVGAYVPPSLMEAGYSMLSSVPETQYTWSSRGPTADGDQGVCISAVGGAIAPIPNWCLARNQLMNGTSMSSPAACGGLALLLSALKAEKVHYTPQSIRRAIENTARPVPGVEQLALGCGLLQVDKAFSYLQKHTSYLDQHVIYRVSIPSRANARGIYLREPCDVSRCHELGVSINPIYPDLDVEEDTAPKGLQENKEQNDSEDGVVSRGAGSCSPPALMSREARNKAKVDLEARVTLKSTAAWVTTPGHVLIPHGGRQFNVRVDPTGLEPGLHFAEILGVDSECVERGPLFRVPVTLTVPEPIAKSEASGHEGIRYVFKSLRFQPAQIVRKFLTVPDGATWAEYRIRGCGLPTKRSFILHTGQLRPETAHRESDVRKFFSLVGHDEDVEVLGVQGGSTLEVTLAQFWSSLGDSEVDLEVEFFGVPTTHPNGLALDGAQGIVRLDIASPLRNMSLTPSASLQKVQTPVRPSNSEISVLADEERDSWSHHRRHYQLVLTYAWECKEKTSVTPRAPLLQGRLYESAFGSQFWMLFDANKQLVGSGDAWPDAVSVDKGKYTLRLQVRHDSVSALEPLKDMAVLFETKLGKTINMQVYSTFYNAVSGASTLSKLHLQHGQRRGIFIAGPDQASLKNLQPGDICVGHLSFGLTGPAVKDASKHPSTIAVQYFVSPAPNAKPKQPEAKEAEEGVKDAKDVDPTTVPVPSAGDLPAHQPKDVTEMGGEDKAREDKEKEEKEKKDKEKEKGKFNIQDDLRDMQIDYIKKQSGDKQVAAYEALYPSLIATHPDHLPLLSLSLTMALNAKKREEVISAADALMAKIDSKELAAHFGVHQSADPTPEEQATRKEMTETKRVLIDAHEKKLEALYALLQQPNDKQAAIEHEEKQRQLLSAFHSTLSSLEKWCDRKDATYLRFKTAALKLQGFKGLALKEVNASIDAAVASGKLPSKEVLQERIDLLEEMGWKQHAANERALLLVKFPHSYRLF